MAKEIRLFNDYHTKENILSNHCGVMLKMLYEENPKSFEEVISVLSGLDFAVTPSFEQQIKKSNSYPDIVIEQPSFAIFFETKRTNWFHDPQIERHLKSLHKDRDHNILFLLSNFEEDRPEEIFEVKISEAFEKYDIHIIPITFEQLVETLEATEHSDNYNRYLNEFRDFLDRNNYLPTWKYMLDVVNCAGTINEVRDHNVYICPATGGKYKHRRGKYFGGYKQKNVKYIHEINALVVAEEGGKNAVVEWNNFNLDEKELIAEALEKVNLLRKEEVMIRNMQIFLLQNAAEVNFRKDSDGGLYASKKYFKNIAKKFPSESSKELAEQLQGKTWEEVEKMI
ncbi:hypothetical protein [Bizionia paragorgiae]|uniref:hypothetical protein n=1 Tax=Bizionia paragorgiae TaxID=283786 RepID=UPI003A924F9C